MRTIKLSTLVESCLPVQILEPIAIGNPSKDYSRKEPSKLLDVVDG